MKALYYEFWFNAVKSVKRSLHAPLLAKNNDTDELYTNFDSKIFEAIQETRWLMKLKYEVPPFAKELILKEKSLKSNKIA